MFCVIHAGVPLLSATASCFPSMQTAFPRVGAGFPTLIHGRTHAGTCTRLNVSSPNSLPPSLRPSQEAGCRKHKAENSKQKGRSPRVLTSARFSGVHSESRVPFSQASFCHRTFSSVAVGTVRAASPRVRREAGVRKKCPRGTRAHLWMRM